MLDLIDSDNESIPPVTMVTSHPPHPILDDTFSKFSNLSENQDIPEHHSKNDLLN